MVVYLNRTPIIDWSLVRVDLRTEPNKDMCLEEIGLHVQIVSTILGLIVNAIQGRGAPKYSLEGLTHMRFR